MKQLIFAAALAFAATHAAAHGKTNGNCTTVQLTQSRISFGYVKTHARFKNHCPHRVWLEWTTIENGRRHGKSARTIGANGSTNVEIGFDYADEGVPSYIVEWCDHYNDSEVRRAHGNYRC